MKKKKNESKKEQIERWLNDSSAGVSNARVRVIVNADGTIDGEIFVPIQRGEDFDSILERMQDPLRDGQIPKTWIATGFRFEPSARVSIKNDYNRHRGLYQVFSNYYKGFPDSVSVVHDIVAGRFEKGKHVRGMKDKGYRRPNQAIVRVHWNPYNMKPPREGGK